MQMVCTHIESGDSLPKPVKCTVAVGPLICSKFKSSQTRSSPQAAAWKRSTAASPFTEIYKLSSSRDRWKESCLCTVQRNRRHIAAISRGTSEASLHVEGLSFPSPSICRGRKPQIASKDYCFVRQLEDRGCVCRKERQLMLSALVDEDPTIAEAPRHVEITDTDRESCMKVRKRTLRCERQLFTWKKSAQKFYPVLKLRMAASWGSLCEAPVTRSLETG